jgi:ABC-type phosphate transport system ATPase subunit
MVVHKNCFLLFQLPNRFSNSILDNIKKLMVLEIGSKTIFLMEKIVKERGTAKLEARTRS